MTVIVSSDLASLLQTLITYGEPSPEEERAQERVNDAHIIRYGVMAQEVMGKLSAVRFEDVLPMYQDASASTE